jgi:hypothetical protein
VSNVRVTDASDLTAGVEDLSSDVDPNAWLMRAVTTSIETILFMAFEMEFMILFNAVTEASV